MVRTQTVVMIALGALAGAPLARAQDQGAYGEKPAAPQAAPGAGDQAAQPEGGAAKDQQAQPKATGAGEKAPEPQAGEAQVISGTATVTKIDRKSRDVTLKMEDGTTTTVHVPESVTRFDQVKTGDRLNITYQESVAMDVRPHAQGAAPKAEVTEGTQPMAKGSEMYREALVTVKIQSIDPKTGKVTFMGPGGKAETVMVQDPSLRGQLGSLKPGDTVDIKYRQAAVVSLAPASP